MIINHEELKRLNEEKASASVMSIYMCLCAYAQGDNHSFPSLKTIQEYIGGSITLSTISKGLRWLRERAFIKQNHRTSKERFQLIYRKWVKSVSGIVKRALKRKEGSKDSEITSKRTKSFVHSGNRPKNQDKNHSLRERFRSKQNKSKRQRNYTIFFGSKPLPEAESAFGKLIAMNGGDDFSVLSESEREAIVKALKSHTDEHREFREWAWKQHFGIAERLVLLRC
jgi:hypothetical protein